MKHRWLSVLAGLALAAGGVMSPQVAVGARADRCPNDYPVGQFRACYFEGVRPGHGFLGAVDESYLGDPVAGRAYGIDHDWADGPVFDDIAPGAGPGNDISAVWRGRFRFEAGKYQLTVWASDGVEVRIDGRKILDEWRQQDARFGVALALASGSHRVQVAWFAQGAAGRATHLRLHWDRLPDVADGQVSRPVIDAFVVARQDVCIAGDPWTSGPQVVVRNADGSIYRAWQVDDERLLPVGLAPGDPALASYAQVECFSFGFSRAQLRDVRREVAQFGALIEAWSFGTIQPELRVHELSGSIRLHRIATGFWISPGFLEDSAAAYMEKASDFAVAISSNDDLLTGRSYEAFACGGALGADHGMWGAGYAWLACYDALTIVHEWEHQLTWAVNHLMGFDGIYPDRARYPATGYPACGEGDPDIFRWFPDSEDWGVEPDSPWCGLDSMQAGIAEMHLLAHFDPSLLHYPLGELVGNHCRDGLRDFGETAVDSGGSCPAT